MPLTYHDVMTTQLHMLVDAAKAWKKMGNRFGELKTNFEDHVLKVTGDGSWRGEGFQAATSASGVIKHEYGAAKAEALAIFQILDEAYTQFHGFKQDIEKIVKDAEGKGYKVNSHTGEVLYDWGALTPEENRAKTNNPEIGRAIEKAEHDFTSTIKKLVRKVNDADHGVELALRAAVTDHDGKGAAGGFNSAAEGDMEKVEAKRASELAGKIKSGEELSGKQQAEMSVLMRDNSGDKTFSKTFLNGIGGAEGTVQLSKRMAELGYGHDVRNGHYFEHVKGQSAYLGLENSLARTVATATTVPGKVSKFPPDSKEYKAWEKSADGEFYSNYMEDLKEVGTEQYGDRPNATRGYQSFVSMMKNSDADFDDHFLHQLGDDIIAAEDKDGAIWNRHGEGLAGVESDPLDGVMGLMSKDPDTATAFLDPSGTDNLEKNDHLKYLLKDREWPEVISGEGGYGLRAVDDPSSHAGFGKALEAAATGQQPLGPGDHPRADATHTAPQARVMESAISIVDPGVGGDDIPENLQKPLAHALADYAPDTHESLDRVSDEARDNLGVKGSADDARMSADPGALTRVMRGVSDDPAAYSMILEAEREQIKQEVSALPADAKPNDARVLDTMQHASKSMGVFDSIQQDITTDVRKDKHEDAEWNAKVMYHIVGGAVAPIPVVGDAIDRAADTWTWDMSEDQKEDATDEANAKIAKRYLNSEAQMRYTVRDWGESAGYQRDSPEINNLQESALQARNDVRDEASRQLGNEEY